MIILSFNARGVGSAPKILSLKRLIEISKPDIVLIQETMCLVAKAKEVFSSFMKEWTLVASNAMGISGGLLTALKPNISVLIQFSSLRNFC
jgi:exonuclease III